jgi:hypothetical protein
MKEEAPKVIVERLRGVDIEVCQLGARVHVENGQRALQPIVVITLGTDPAGIHKHAITVNARTIHRWLVGWLVAV